MFFTEQLLQFYVIAFHEKTCPDLGTVLQTVISQAGVITVQPSTFQFSRLIVD